MKILNNYIFQTLLFVAAVLSMQSCGCNNDKFDTVDKKVTEIMSDDVAVAYSGDVDRLFTALDVTVKDDVPQMPQYMTDLLNVFASKSDRQSFEDLLQELKGVKYSNL